MSLKNIISYVDLGHSSRKGVQLAGAIAETHSASVEIVHTAAKMPFYSTAIGGEHAYVPPGIAMSVLDKTMEAVEARLREALETLGREHVVGDITTHALDERQVDMLIEHARSRKADLIVTSCEEAGLLDKVFHRMFAEKLARHASCPVMVMAGEGEVKSPLRNILVTTDYSESSRRSALVAREIVGSGGKMTFQHVLPQNTPSSLIREEAFQVESPSESWDVEVMRLEQFVQDLDLIDVEIECYVSGGEPHDEIARLADEIDADVIVVGSHPHENWGETLFGTVADRLIEISKRPVLAVPKIASTRQSWSTVDETVAQSFPASDAPSWWAGRPN